MQIQEEIRRELQQKFVFIALLGKGAFGDVYHCQDHIDSQHYAVKIISKLNVKQSKIQNLKQQAKLLKSMAHPNIVKIYEYGEVESCIFIKMEIASQGNLQTLIEKRKKEGVGFTDEEIAKIMGQIFKGLSYIHSLNIIHRDIKPQNVLITTEKSAELVKIADFGLSTKLDSHYPKSAIAKCGTLLFMAPQILCKYSYTKAIDIWSASIIMFILFNGQHPFWKQKMSTDQYTIIMSKKIVFPNLKNASNLAQNFFHKICKSDPQERYSAQQGLKHPWITRKFTDQIPLAVHESYSSFATANQIVNVMKLCISTHNLIGKDRSEVPSSYLSKLFNENPTKEMLSTSSKLKKLKSLNMDRQLSSSVLEQKIPLQKRKLRMISQSEGQNPTISKLNLIFNTLFDKKITGKSKIEKKDMTRELQEEIIEMSHFKDRVESEIEKCVNEALVYCRKHQRRILPVRNSPGKQFVSEGCIKSSFSLVSRPSFVRKSAKVRKTHTMQQKLES